MDSAPVRDRRCLWFLIGSTLVHAGILVIWAGLLLAAAMGVSTAAGHGGLNEGIGMLLLGLVLVYPVLAPVGVIGGWIAYACTRSRMAFRLAVLPSIAALLIVGSLGLYFATAP